MINFKETELSGNVSFWATFMDLDCPNLGENKTAAETLINYADRFFSLCCSWRIDASDICTTLCHYRINWQQVVKFYLHRKKYRDQHIFWNPMFIWGAWPDENEYTDPSLTIAIYAPNLNNHHQESTENKSRDFLPGKGKGGMFRNFYKGQNGPGHSTIY